MKINSLSQNLYAITPQKDNRNSNNITSFRGLNLNIIKSNNVVDIFEALVKIPSPPLKEGKVAKWILDFCKSNKINARLDSYKNVKVEIPMTDATKKPILLSAHMDVVGDDSPINLVKDGDFIRTDGKRTLGADDKAGVASALRLAQEVVNSDIKHGGLEMLFTRDEELGMTGIMNADFNTIKSKYVLVLDEAKLGQFDNSGAGYTTVNLSVTTPYGGHSGMDIGDKKRLNAAKVISELISKFPQGIFFKNKNGQTSINVGTIIAGDIQNSASKIVDDGLKSEKYIDFFMANSVTNVINTNARATLSIRSSDINQENKLRQKLMSIVDWFNSRYKNLAFIDISFEELMPIFEKSSDKTLEGIYKKVSKNLGLKPSIGTFPAGAETHIYCNKQNSNNERFIPALLGIADIYNMHSPLEKISISSLNKGYELLKQMFLNFNRAQ